MKSGKNLYFRYMFMRKHPIRDAFDNFFIAFCAYPRLLLEVFIRRDFGRRYFSFSSAMFLFLVLATLPLIALLFFRDYLPQYSTVLFFGLFSTWYAYLAGFLYMSIKRRQELKRHGNLDLTYFTKSSGFVHPRFLNFHFRGKQVTPRTIETVLEPGFFFIIGFNLWIFGQPLGHLLAICSIFYSLSYRAAYRRGDHYIWDKTDEWICNRVLAPAFLEGRNANESLGFQFRGHRPANPEMREQIVKTFFEEEEIVEAM
ncbi:hypothetical protein [Larkinella sp.]|uniref:hypothetical protein n=1 Tax=Larkinella sp. TaxID=2034517 RepID=UPI003BA87734